MTNQTPEIELFFKEWSNEFSRSIEMFTGEKAAVSYTLLAGGDTETRTDVAGYLWWKQVFERNGQLAYWIGADESVWNALGSSADGTPNDPQRAYLEIIGQANQAIAAVVSRRTPQPLVAKEGSIGAQPQMNTVVAAEIAVSFKEKTLTPLIELDRNVGEFVDLIVHGTVVARGEVVSVKGNYGVRIKQIISRQDRLA